MTDGNHQQISARKLKACFVVTGVVGASMLLWAFLSVPFQPYSEADQIFTSVHGLSVHGQSGKETHDQVVAALRAGERVRQLLVGQGERI